MLRAPYTVNIAALPVRCIRAIGSVRKVVKSQTPDRTRGSANSSSTAETPPTNNPIGFLKTRQETESGGTRPLSPTGPDKSGIAPLRLCKARAIGASHRSRPRSQTDLAISSGMPDRN